MTNKNGKTTFSLSTTVVVGLLAMFAGAFTTWGAFGVRVSTNTAFCETAGKRLRRLETRDAVIYVQLTQIQEAIARIEKDMKGTR